MILLASIATADATGAALDRPGRTDYLRRLAVHVGVAGAALLVLTAWRWSYYHALLPHALTTKLAAERYQQDGISWKFFASFPCSRSSAASRH